MRYQVLGSIALSLLPATGLLARGDGTFRAAFSIINAGRPGPATVHAGDFNGDGKMDLAAANGSPSILVYFQSPTNRLEWKQVPLRVASLVWFVRAADFTGDGFDDLVAADISATAFFIRSLGNGAFDRPVPVPGSIGARWTAVGDWDNDGNMDFATANVNAADITTYLGDGQGGFTLKQRLPGSREHSLEALDYDGDGFLDLMLGTGLTGLTPHRGRGDGTFEVKPSFEHMGCVEYIAEIGHYRGGRYVLTGDFNKDGKCDLAATCVETTSASAGISLGDATFKETLEVQAGPDVDSVAIADLNGDGYPDLAVASKGWPTILVYLGKGDGEFHPDPVAFGSTGDTPSFLIPRDLDGDGRFDLVSGDVASSTITIMWGAKDERFLESSFTLAGHPPSKAMAAGDLDRDGVPDLFFAGTEGISVYLEPGRKFPRSPSLVIKALGGAGALEAADLDGDQVLDLLGTHLAGGKLLLARVDAAGKVLGEAALDAGLSPSSVEVGELDGRPPLDVAVPCQGSNHVAIFLGGEGGMNPAAILPTVEKPRGAALGRFDADEPADIAVISNTAVVLHYGTGAGQFTAAVPVVQDATKLYTEVAAGDLNGDSKLDLAVSESRTLSVLLFPGMGNREFEPSISVKTNGSPVGVVLADLDGDGLLDVTATNSTARSASILQNGGSWGFPGHLVYGLGVVPAFHRVLDLDLDGALDLAAFSPTAGVIVFGRPAGSAAPRFRRGDVSADGVLAINDPILVLSRLFLGGEPLPCEDAADADDDGFLLVNDSILILGRLFLGGAPLPPPGPENCGDDLAADALECATGCV